MSASLQRIELALRLSGHYSAAGHSAKAKAELDDGLRTVEAALKAHPREDALLRGHGEISQALAALR